MTYVMTFTKSGTVFTHILITGPGPPTLGDWTSGKVIAISRAKAASILKSMMHKAMITKWANKPICAI